MRRRVGVLGQPVPRVGERRDELGHVEPVDEVVEHRLGRRVLEEVAAVVDDQQRVPGRPAEPGRQVKRDASVAAHAEGNIVQPTITIPANSTGLTINQQGQVSVTLPGSTTSSILGQITLTTFINDAGLQATGNNLFVATPASGTPQNGVPGINGAGTLLQGSLEQSNVSAVTEISNLIAAQRAYEMNSKVITAADEMLQTTAQLMK